MSFFKGLGPDLNPFGGLSFKEIPDGGLVNPLYILYSNKIKFQNFMENLKSSAEQIDNAVNATLNQQARLITTNRLLINENNRVLLPSKALGDIIWNTALVFENETSNVIIAEVTVSIDETGTYLLFDESDNITSKYCIVSYLTNKVL